MRLLLPAVMALAVAACASIGRPEGGAKDETPPEFVKSDPMPGTLNFNKEKIEVYFNENIKVEDASNKIVVSPVQQQQPQVMANGKKLTLTLRDSLLPDETYTIDFADAVRDLNEGNILDGFVIDFATGDSIDTLRVSGMVLQASNLEPAQGMIVGAYTNLADSAISTIRIERICKTNQLGQFTLRNLKDTTYRLFAINDVNRDFHWDRSEDIAFYNEPIRPWTEDFIVTDTLRAHDGSDSTATRPGVRFMPNNILLTWFNEEYKPQYLREYTRADRHLIRLEFGAPSDTFPVLKVVNGPNEGKAISDYSKLNYNLTRDTLEYWLSDSDLIKQDSLLIETKYLKTDSNSQLSWTTDTLRYFFKLSRAKEKELQQQQKDKEEKEKKRQEKIKKALETGDSAALADTMPEPDPITYLTIKALANSSHDINRPVRLLVSEPVNAFDSLAVHLEWKDDTTWIELDNIEISQDTTGKLMEYVVSKDWEYEKQYRLSIDSAALKGIYNHWNEEFKFEFTIKKAEDYSTLIFNIPSKSYNPEPPYDWSPLIPIQSIDSIAVIDSITDNVITDSLMLLPSEEIILPIDSVEVIPDGPETHKKDSLPPIIVELLNSQDNAVVSVPVINGQARFDFLNPGTYFVRAYIDFNDNGKWDTGLISEWRQPEDVFYYPKKINLKQNWDMSQTWDLFEIPVEMQKPLEIKKNKPKTKEGQDQKSEEEDEEDEFGSNYFYQGQSSYGNGAQYNNAGFQRNPQR